MLRMGLASRIWQMGHTELGPSQHQLLALFLHLWITFSPEGYFVFSVSCPKGH